MADEPAANDLIGPPDSAMLSQPSAAEAQTSRFMRQRKKYEGGILDPPTEITGDDDYAALDPGRRFIGPDKKIRVKPYEVKSDEDYDLVPEGAQFLDSEGKTRQKPVAEPISFSAQTLYGMATSPETREQALKKFYGDKVKRDTRGEFYVDDEGVLRRPGERNAATVGAGLVSEAAPAAGMLIGGRLGVAIGAAGGTLVEPGGGTAIGGGAGGAFGAMLGAAAGRQLNNVVLGLAGIHQDIPTQVKSLASEAVGVGAGELGGRALASIPAAMAATRRTATGVRDTAGSLRENLPHVLEQFGVTPERARKFLGTTQDMAERASNITREEVQIPGQTEKTNVKVPPSVYAPESPYLKKIEEFDRVFRSQDVVAQSWEAYYNKQAQEILSDKSLGVSIDELATRATKKVSSEHAGMLALTAARKDMAAADAELENARRDAVVVARRPIDQAGGEQAVGELRQQAMDRLKAAYDRSQASAQATIQQAAANLRNDIETSIRAAAEGEDTSDLNRAISSSFKAYNIGIRQRAKLMYDAFKNTAADINVDVLELSQDADAFLKSMPEQVRQKYPAEIAKLAQIARAMNEGAEQFKAEGIDIVGELGGKNQPVDTNMSIADLHHLRSWFRHGIDYNDMTPDMRAGSMKYFEQKINDLIRRGGTEESNRLLDEADAFYKANIPFMSDRMVQGTIDMLKSGEGANPEALAKMFFDPERTSAMRRVRGIVGENLWRGVQAADVRHMLDNSRIIGSTEIDATKFAAQVEDRLKNGILETAYDTRTANRLRKIAEDVKTLAGQLPMKAGEGDTISTLMQRAALLKAEADKFAEMDPLKALREATSKIEKQHQQAMKIAKATRQQEPLHHLYEESQSHLATRAANKILGSQDLIMAAATQFGRDSPEFDALRQVYVQRFMQREFPKTAAMRAELGGEKGMTEEVQALMFPGVTRSQMLTLAKNMEFLFSAGGTDIGGSLAAAGRVLHPEANFPIQFKALKIAAGLPLAGTAMRFTLGKFYALMIDATTHPNFINWLAGRLGGDAAARSQARAAVQNRLRMGALLGRGAGQQMLAPQQDNSPQ